MPFGLGPTELFLIFAVVLLFFGGKRLPEVASGMGRGIRDFKRALSGVDDESIAAGTKAQPLNPPAQAPAPPAVTPADEPKRLA
jgi:sec-independent protein translocase protein TatA